MTTLSVMYGVDSGFTTLVCKATSAEVAEEDTLTYGEFVAREAAAAEGTPEYRAWLEARQ